LLEKNFGCWKIATQFEKKPADSYEKV